MKMKQIYCGLLLMGMIQSVALAEDQSLERPFYLDVDLGGFIFTGDDAYVLVSGFGYGIDFGYRLLQVYKPLSVELSYFGNYTTGSFATWISTNFFTLGPRLTFPLPVTDLDQIEFFVHGGFGGGYVWIVDESTSGVYVAKAGLGIQYRFKPLGSIVPLIGPSFDVYAAWNPSVSDTASVVLAPLMTLTARF